MMLYLFPFFQMFFKTTKKPEQPTCQTSRLLTSLSWISSIGPVIFLMCFIFSAQGPKQMPNTIEGSQDSGHGLCNSYPLIASKCGIFPNANTNNTCVFQRMLHLCTQHWRFSPECWRFKKYKKNCMLGGNAFERDVEPLTEDWI